MSDVVEVRPAHWRLPAARVAFSDGAAMWAIGADTEPFAAAVLACAPNADNQLPSGKWLRPRRNIGWALAIAAGIPSN